MNVYITKAARFLPNEAVSNDEMEDYLGMVDGKPSRAKPLILYRNGIKQRYYALDKEGNVVNSCDYTEIEKMEYVTDEYDEDGNLKNASANCLKYRSADWHYGLMDRNGNIITPPLYDDITAIAVNLYHCEGEEGSVLLDDKGRECGEKL